MTHALLSAFHEHQSQREEIIVVSNGRKVARLTAYDTYEAKPAEPLQLNEPAEAYTAYPRRATYTGVREYWIVNPSNREVTIYQFENADLTDSRSWHAGQRAQSFIFSGLHVEVNTLFR